MYANVSGCKFLLCSSSVCRGGVMLVHDLHRKETRVIDFQGTAPKALKEVMLQNVSGLKAGLRVGVPGLLRGLHHAHSLYGSLLWEDVVTRAAAVAEDGFNVSFSLAEAISKVQGEHLSQRFRDTFLPGGRPLLPGSFLRMSSLAAVLRGGLSNFYDGNFSLEMEDEVQTNGGVLSRDDISNYSVEVGQPLEGLYNEFVIQVPPPSSAGAALISALKLLEGLQLNGNNDTENQTHHWIAEAVKGALAKARGLGDASLNSSVTELLSDLLSMTQARVLHQGVNSSHTSPPELHSLRTELMAGQVVVMGPDGLMVSIASSLSTPFGSRLMTVSGVILNGLILDFYWPDKTPGRRSSNQKNPVQPGARPQTPLMPTIVVPARHKCGLYTALSSSGGPRSLSVVTQVLIRALSLNKERNESLSLGRLHSNRQPSRRLDYRRDALTGETPAFVLKHFGVAESFPPTITLPLFPRDVTVKRLHGRYPRGTPHMDPKAAAREKFFLVLRGKSRKGFSQGGVGRVDAETPCGQLTGALYSGGAAAGSPRGGCVVRREDTHPLTRRQAQLLLFVSSAKRRVELLRNAPLFSAVCELAQGDQVVVKYKKGHYQALVRNLMEIGRKDEDKEDLRMLGFEVEFVDHDPDLSSKEPAPLFSAADIIQVVPSYSVQQGLRWRDGLSGGPNRKVVTRSHSMPVAGSRPRQVGENRPKSAIQSQSLSTAHVSLEVGSMVEVVSNSGVTVYGVVQWLGVPEGKTAKWAGIELDYEVKSCCDGMYRGQRYFTCKVGRALFVPVTKLNPDRRFVSLSTGNENLKPTDEPPDPEFEDPEEDVPPIPESEALSLLVGRMKGIQGHINSCYLDATLFSLFGSSMTLDNIWKKPADTEKPITCTLRKVVNRLRRQGFVPAESVMNFRKELGCDTFRTEEKDPEEFITVLFQKVLCMQPLIKLRSGQETCQGAYTLQIFLEKEQMGQMPSVQQLLDTSCLSGDLKFEEVGLSSCKNKEKSGSSSIVHSNVVPSLFVPQMPSCLMVQMPRFGNKYKMFSHIIPSTELDITDLLYNSPRECFICGHLAAFECLQCLPDRKLQPGRIKQYCSTCNSQVHSHPARQGHSPKALSVPARSESPVPRHVMQLLAVLCIQTSHYVSFVKFGPDPRSWVFFDSMADRCGDGPSGYSIPVVRACPELGDFLYLPEEELARSNHSQAPELVRRLLSDSYMFLYQNPATPLSKPNQQEC
uniref:Glutathione hydrolase n=1 Tax=Gasterosteus aculeatus aculeatus TaxID=481459 RepID=A0AAQ4QAR7_GASAC